LTFIPRERKKEECRGTSEIYLIDFEKLKNNLLNSLDGDEAIALRPTGNTFNFKILTFI